MIHFVTATFVGNLALSIALLCVVLAFIAAGVMPRPRWNFGHVSPRRGGYISAAQLQQARAMRPAHPLMEPYPATRLLEYEAAFSRPTHQLRPSPGHVIRQTNDFSIDDLREVD